MLNVFLKKVRDFVLPNYPWDEPHYPYDLDASQRITRFQQGGNYYPYPYITHIFYQPVAEIMNAWLAQSQGRTPYGPGVTTWPINNQWQINLPINKFTKI